MHEYELIQNTEYIRIPYCLGLCDFFSCIKILQTKVLLFYSCFIICIKQVSRIEVLRSKGWSITNFFGQHDRRTEIIIQ